MVKVEGGTFLMGDIFSEENEDALPIHTVTVEDFYIGKYEVTYEEYDRFAAQTNREKPNDRGYGRGKRAVSYVTWYDARAFCNYYGYRLPTEQEWEYAARSGGQKERYAGTGNLDSLDNYAITERSELNFSYFVGTKKPNDLGLFDMSGNVFELVGEFYQSYSNQDERYDLEHSGVRIIRGGSFHEVIETNQVFWRVGTLDEMVASDVGFRCAVSAEDY